MSTPRRAPVRGGPGALGWGTAWWWAAALAVLCVVGPAVTGPWQPETRETEVRTAPIEAPPPQPVPSAAPDEAPLEIADPEPPPDLRWLYRALVAVAALVALVLLVRWALRLPARRGAPTEPAPALPGAVVPLTDALPDARALRAGAEAAEHHLRRDVSPTDAVIAAWVALEEAAARSGVTRAASSTPTEFTLDVLDRTPADPAAARALLDVYLRARFGDAPLAPADVASAADAARTLALTLGAADGAGAGAGPARPAPAPSSSGAAPGGEPA